MIVMTKLTAWLTPVSIYYCKNVNIKIILVGDINKLNMRDLLRHQSLAQNGDAIMF